MVTGVIGGVPDELLPLPPQPTEKLIARIAAQRQDLFTESPSRFIGFAGRWRGKIGIPICYTAPGHCSSNDGPQGLGRRYGVHCTGASCFFSALYFLLRTPDLNQRQIQLPFGLR